MIGGGLAKRTRLLRPRSLLRRPRSRRLRSSEVGIFVVLPVLLVAISQSDAERFSNL